MAQITNEQMIEMLNEDLRGEHAAIIQYLRHAYAMGEGELACEIEAIAREEMYHFKWLSEAIVDLGGKPSLVRGEMLLGGDTPPEWMERDVRLEQDAIDLYEEHIRLIDDPKVKRLLERIVSDERSHKGDFTHFVDKAKREMAEAAEAPAGSEAGSAAADQNVLDILNAGVRHEYTVILQYLYHSFLTPDCEISRELEFQAINEMQHMGWLSEEVAGSGADPDMEHTELDLSENTADMLKADIAAERAVTKDYNNQIKQLEDEGLKTLLTRIRDHEIYHDALFSEMLEKMGKAPDVSAVDARPLPPPAAADSDEDYTIPTIGSLIGS